MAWLGLCQLVVAAHDLVCVCFAVLLLRACLVPMVVGPAGGQHLYAFGGLVVSLLLVVCFVLARVLSVCLFVQPREFSCQLTCLAFLPAQFTGRCGLLHFT